MARHSLLSAHPAQDALVSAFVIGSLGLGIGANTAIFSLIDQMLLRNLPVQQPEQLVWIATDKAIMQGRTSNDDAGPAVFSYPFFRDMEKQQQAFQSIAAFRQVGANIAYRGRTVSGSLLNRVGRPTFQRFGHKQRWAACWSRTTTPKGGRWW